MSSGMSRAVVALALVFAGRGIGVAQSADPGLPRGYVGVSAAVAFEDPVNRMRLYDDERLYAIGVDAGLRVNHAVGIGVELHRPSEVYGATLIGAGRAQIAGIQREWAVVALLRARLFGSARAAFDVVGGGGLMHQQHMRGGCQPPAPVRCEQFADVSLEKSSPVGVFGLELPLSLSTHLSLVPQARVWMLARGDHWTDPATGFDFEWQHQFQSGNRLTTGVAARLTW